MTTTIKEYHTAIIGTGAAGLTAAIHLARQLSDEKILVGTKARLHSSSSSYAQGGIAVPWDVPFDSEENHIRDTIEAGSFKNNLEVVRIIIGDARPRIAELAQWGMPFDRRDNGTLRLHREGGHSHHRVAHHGDQTGKALIDTLIEKLIDLPNVDVMDQLFATELVMDERNHCVGFKALSGGGPLQVVAQNTILATGGIGQLYETTTNPDVATGDGIAMAYRAGAAIKNMAFIQFHPTAW
jgi:L-aspartate oxidase